jgi:DNA-binding MltR family transcriptional regulator
MDRDAGKIDLTDESDRGCILVAAALLEESLELRFRDLFQSKEIPKSVQDSLLGSNGALATFSSKIKMAYAVGLLPRETFTDLEEVRKMRNQAAHLSKDFDFLNEAIGRKIESLICVQLTKNDFIQRYKFTLTDSEQPAGTKSDNASKEKVKTEARARLAGYVKYHKSLLAIAVSYLELEIKLGLPATKIKEFIEAKGKDPSTTSSKTES